MNDQPPPPAAPAPAARSRRTVGWSLRARLVLLVLALLALGVGTAGALTVALLHSSLISQLDDQLAATARTLDGATLERLMLGQGSEPGMPSDYYVHLRTTDGSEYSVASTRTTRDFGRPRLAAHLGDATDGHTVGSDEPGSRWRAMTFPTRGATGTGELTVALPLAGVAATTSDLIRLVVLIGLAITALGGALGWVGVHRALAPLRGVERTAAAIADGDLSQRVPPAPAGTEIGRLSLALNTMLAQIEQAFAARAASERQMRRFVSDASHELRTPLATVRGYGELYRMGGIPAEELPGAMARIEGEATRMGELVADLLTLARLDEDRLPQWSEVDLHVLAREAAADLHAMDPARAITVSVPQAPAGAWLVRGDEASLRQVLANLAGNVVAHTPAGSPVELAVARGTGAVVLEVRDRGPGIDPAEAERVFQRFYRPDRSRTRSSGGSGLGLAIVAAAVAAHGGTVRLEPTPGGGTTVRVELPALTPGRA